MRLRLGRSVLSLRLLVRPLLGLFQPRNVRAFFLNLEAGPDSPRKVDSRGIKDAFVSVNKSPSAKCFAVILFLLFLFILCLVYAARFLTFSLPQRALALPPWRPLLPGLFFVAFRRFCER